MAYVLFKTKLRVKAQSILNSNRLNEKAFNEIIR